MMDKLIGWFISFMLIVLAFIVLYPIGRHLLMVFFDFWDLTDIRGFDCLQTIGK